MKQRFNLERYVARSPPPASIPRVYYAYSSLPSSVPCVEPSCYNYVARLPPSSRCTPPLDLLPVFPSGASKSAQVNVVQNSVLTSNATLLAYLPTAGVPRVYYANSSFPSFLPCAKPSCYNYGPQAKLPPLSASYRLVTITPPIFVFYTSVQCPGCDLIFNCAIRGTSAQ